MIDLLFLALDAWLIYIGIKQENNFLLLLVAVTLVIDLMSGLQVLSHIRW
ncbi:MAG: hypothetical protein ACRCTE_00595 [Cellulosilyticaceae bacterium]